MNARIKVLEALARQAETLRASPDHEVAAEAAAVKELSGQHLVVLDRGFVYVGEVRRDGDLLCITNARNVRKWGTENGLGELRTGPRPSTVLDVCGEVLVPWRAVQHLIPCSGF